MIPSAENSDYPEFVADQVLTSDNLNDLFGYLDEQGRMTRTNLTGIGIVCGLKVRTAANGSITITKGVGVTSSGYLVSVPEITYTKRTTTVFDAVKCEYYDKFVTNGSPRTQRFDLWELKQEAETTGTTALTQAFLNDGEKIVLIFVELLEENNKNCDPDSCDDKGAKVTVTFRPLLVSKANASTLISSSDNNITSAKFNSLPDVFLPRWNVPNTSPVNADQIISGYKNILTQNFIQSVQTALSLSYSTFQPVIVDEYPADPFAAYNLVTHFNFLYNGTINTNQSIHIQYYYDLFSDLIEAYNEFCITGSEILSTCCPDESLFPRHLLLGEAIPLALDTPSAYRHYFMYSPLFERKDLLVTLKSLFRRMDLMVKNFLIPPVATAISNSIDQNIKIIPSKLSRAPLSAKAIPYYFTPKVAPVPLYKYWSMEKSLRNRAQQILSYNSNLYNNTDDFVKQPLKYDLEPYNFFRIEGITGKQLKLVLDSINSNINNSRLPIQVVPVATGNPLAGSDDDDCCCFSDIELQFQLLRSEILCCLKSNIRYWASLEKRDDGKGIVIAEPPRVSTNAVVKEAPDKEAAVVKEKSFRSSGTMVVGENLVKGETAMGISGNQVTVNYVKGDFLNQSLSEIKEYSIATEYLGYQAQENISIASLPAPRTNAEVENITYYVLIIIDELEELAGLLSEQNIENFNMTGFMVHAEKLSKACTKLDKLLSAYSLTEYQIDKIRLNAPSKTAEADKIAAAMPVISEDDTYKIILLLLNLSSTTDFIAQLVKSKGNYAAQEKIITAFYNSLDKDGMLIPIIKEPDPRTESRYSSIREHLRNEMCICDIEKLKILIDKYVKQKATLSDVNNFSVYTKNHPGIQHKAGVTSGGTFIIVYKGSNDPRQDIAANTVIGDFYLPYSCCSDCTPVQVIIQEPPPPVNLPPVAKAGDDLTIQLPVNEVTLDGATSSDPDGTIKTYLWENKSGPAGFVIEDSSAAKTKVSKLAEGEYVFKLTVTDDDNSSSADDVKITVQALAKIPPTANAGPDQVIEIVPAISHVVTGTAQLDGSLSADSDGTITTYSWAKISGPPAGVISSPASVKTLATGLTVGVYVFELTVTDNDSLTGKDQVTIVVNVKNTQPPVANAGPSKTITLPQNSVELDGSASSDPDGTIVSYNWIKISGPTTGTINTPTLAKTIVSGLTEGVYTFELTVTDNDSLSAKAQVVVVVLKRNNQPPIADAGKGQTITFPQNNSVVLDGSASIDPDGTLVSFNWQKITGPSVGTFNSTLQSPTVTFIQAGVYVFELTVTDNDGFTDKSQVTIIVNQSTVSKSCAPLNDIIIEFNGLKTVDTAANFKLFGAQYDSFKEIQTFYKLMSDKNIAALPVNDQIKFFIEQKIEFQLVAWIENLTAIIQESTNLRLLALSMLNIHAQLTYYIACIQNEDVDKADVKMLNALQAILKILAVIQPIVANFTQAQKAVLAELLDITETELKRVINNGEETKKPQYVEMLHKIIELLNSMNL